MMKILVTGASGFIGGYLIQDLLNHRYKVRALTRNPELKIKGVEIVVGDITKPQTLHNVVDGVEAVFHNAAYAIDWGKKADFYRVNLQGTRHIAEACEKTGVKKLIYTSSAGIYGFPNRTNEITEQTPPHPLNAYQRSKLGGEKELQRFKNLQISIVRPPLVLGAGSNAVRLLLSNIKQRQLMYIGDGKQFISIVHPADVAQCLRLILEKNIWGETFNVVSFICPLKELIEKSAKQLGVTPPTKHVSYFLAYIKAIFSEFFAQEPSITRFRVKSLGTTRKISCKKARTMLGYIPGYNLKSTVEDIVTWYQKTFV